MLYQYGSVDYAVSLKFLHCTKKVREFLNDEQPIISTTSLAVLRNYNMMRHANVLFAEVEDCLENNKGQQEKVRVIFWRETADEEPSAALLLATDNETRNQLYGNVKQVIETSIC